MAGKGAEGSLGLLGCGEGPLCASLPCHGSSEEMGLLFYSHLGDRPPRQVDIPNDGAERSWQIM